MSDAPRSSLAVKALAICLRDTTNAFARDLADTIDAELVAEHVRFDDDWDQAGISEWVNALRRFIPRPAQ